MQRLVIRKRRMVAGRFLPLVSCKQPNNTTLNILEISYEMERPKGATKNPLRGLFSLEEASLVSSPIGVTAFKSLF